MNTLYTDCNCHKLRPTPLPVAALAVVSLMGGMPLDGAAAALAPASVGDGLRPAAAGVAAAVLLLLLPLPLLPPVTT